MKWAVFGALAGSIATMSVLTLMKVRKLQKDGGLLQTQLASGGSQLARALTSRGEEIKNEVASQATSYAEPLAKATGQQYIFDTYGLNEQRIARIKTLGRTLGI